MDTNNILKLKSHCNAFITTMDLMNLQDLYYNSTLFHVCTYSEFEENMLNYAFFLSKESKFTFEFNSITKVLKKFNYKES